MGLVIALLALNGATFFFIAVYLHMFRALMYGSYQNRELIWLFGMFIFTSLLMAEAFMGYVLP